MARRSIFDILEYRNLSVDLQATSESGRVVRGSIPIDVDQDIGGGRVERFMPGSLKHGDALMLREHDRTAPLAREPGTLKIEERDGRLHVSAEIIDTTIGNDALKEIRAEMMRLSFGFLPIQTRMVEKVRRIFAARLVEISSVTFAAHTGTQLRSEWEGNDPKTDFGSPGFAHRWLY